MKTEETPIDKFIVVVEAGPKKCIGCFTQLIVGEANDQILHCANGTDIGGTLVVSNTRYTPGTCQLNYLQPPNDECIIDGDCKICQDVEFAISDGSCFSTNPIGFQGPANPSIQPLAGYYKYENLCSTASCSTTDNTSPESGITVYPSPSGGTPIGYYGFKIKCPKCEKNY